LTLAPERARALSLTEISEAANNTFIELVATADFIEPMNGITLILVFSASHLARRTSVWVLSLDRASAVRNGQGQRKEDQRRGKKSKDSPDHFYRLLSFKVLALTRDRSCGLDNKIKPLASQRFSRTVGPKEQG
jgi:hypothetical protein